MKIVMRVGFPKIAKSLWVEGRLEGEVRVAAEQDIKS